VVTKDVPDGATAVGVPARVIRKKSPLPEGERVRERGSEHE
jgi:acetyltransferase-like isoleucine patch superfamily enzyme